MSVHEFVVSLGFVFRANPLGAAKLFVPKGYSLRGGDRLFEIYDNSQKGDNRRAGYIFFSGDKVQLTAQPYETGEKLMSAWFEMYPRLNPKRLVWRLFVPGVYERRIRGYIPDTKIGEAQTSEELDQKIGDTQFPLSTIAGQYEADALSFFDSSLPLKGWCHIKESCGLSSSFQSEQTIHITNPTDWSDDR